MRILREWRDFIIAFLVIAAVLLLGNTVLGMLRDMVDYWLGVR